MRCAATPSSNGCAAGWPTRNSPRGWKSWCAIAAWTGLPDDGDGEAALVMRAIAVLDPLAPLCWRGMALWPDGIGTALAAAQGSDPDTVARLEEIIIREETSNWAALRADRCDFAVLRVEARQQHSWLQQRAPGRRRAATDLPAQPDDALCQPAGGRALGGTPDGPAAGAGGDGGPRRPPADRTHRYACRGLHLRAAGAAHGQ